MQQKPRVGAALAATLICLPVASHAEDLSRDWWLHVGPVHVGFDSSTQLIAGGNILPGADATASDNWALGVELGYAVTPSNIVSLTVGSPPTTTLTGKGAVVNGIELGQVQYGPAVLTVHHHWDLGLIRPYLGAGVNYTLALNTTDGAVAGLAVRDGWGAAIQAGFDVPIDQRWSVFLDFKQIWLKTEASGSLPAFGGIPAIAEVRLNPFLIHAGMGLRF